MRFLKGKEVDKLKQEVKRLAGEVQVLRCVVEEGLKECRSFREQPASQDQESSAEWTSTFFVSVELKSTWQADLRSPLVVIPYRDSKLNGLSLQPPRWYASM